MITAIDYASPEDFEALLDHAINALKTTVSIAPPMGSFGFENAVFKAMQNAAKDTSFERYIEKTPPHAFPDIKGQKYYGVEVKQIHKNSSRTRGNSIFEQARDANVKKIYLLMCWHAREPENCKIDWRRYEDAIDGIVITHSPRYAVDVLLPQGKSFFDRIGVPYDSFRKLPQNAMMELVRKEYTQTDKSLWWLDEQDRQPLRNIELISKEELYTLIGEAFFLCPEIFGGDNRRKYTSVVAYWMSRGVVCQVVRDKFTSGGKAYLRGRKVPQIIFRAGDKRKEDIFKAAETLDEDIVGQFWDLEQEDVPPPKDRIKKWLYKVREHYGGSTNDLSVLEKVFLTSDRADSG